MSAIADPLKLIRAVGRCYKDHPVGYAEHFLRRPLTPAQAEILESLQRPPYRTLVPSANTQGKTFVAAVQCSYFYDTHIPSVTLATAPNLTSVKDLLFKELRGIRPYTHGFLEKSPRLQCRPDHYVHGLTASKSDAFQGRHAEYLGLLFDEATGIDPTFWERGETMFGGHPGHWWLATYNPNDVSSYAFQVEDRGGWNVVRLNALDHPNIAAELAGLPAPIPSAIRLETVLRRLRTECTEINPATFDEATDFLFPRDHSPVVGPVRYWRPTTPAFEAQILGRWPIAGSESVWTPLVVDRLRKHLFDINPEWPTVGGVDVARFGRNRSTLCVRKGPAAIHLEALPKTSTRELAERIRLVLTAIEGSQDKAMQCHVNIDETGGYGSSLLDLADGWNWHGVCSSETSPDPRFPNVRSHLWWSTRHMADESVIDLSHLPDRAYTELRRELVVPRYHLDHFSRRVVENKNQMKTRLSGQSPDLADAFNLCYYLGV